MNDPRDRLAALLTQAEAWLERAYPDAAKALTGRLIRDEREPARDEKTRHEDAMQAAVMRHFRRLAARVRVALAEMPRVKATLDVAGVNFDDDEFAADLIRILLMAARGGVDVFSTQVLIGMDYSAVNVQAAEWARRYAYELIRGLDDTTRDALQRAVSAFVETPGMTIGDVINALPFDERRAARIATTEITRAYAQGQIEAGQEMQRRHPDVRVVKQWFTNNDDRVCPICAPFDGREVELTATFDGLDSPPAHPNCRCWLGTRTRING